MATKEDREERRVRALERIAEALAKLAGRRRRAPKPTIPYEPPEPCPWRRAWPWVPPPTDDGYPPPGRAYPDVVIYGCQPGGTYCDTSLTTPGSADKPGGKA